MLEKGFAVPELLEPSLPASFSWLPLPSGWLILGAVLLAALALFLLFLAARWRRNRWRREAHAALQDIQTADDWLSLIKRILLIHHPREVLSREVAPEALLHPVPLDNDLRRTLCAKYCQADNHLDDSQTIRLREQLSRWLEGLPDV